MESPISRMKEFFSSDRGAAATEYAFLLAVIVVLAWAALSGMGQSVEASFAAVSTGLE